MLSYRYPPGVQHQRSEEGDGGVGAGVETRCCLIATHQACNISASRRATAAWGLELRQRERHTMWGNSFDVLAMFSTGNLIEMESYSRQCWFDGRWSRRYH